MGENELRPETGAMKGIREPRFYTTAYLTMYPRSVMHSLYARQY